MTNTPNAPEMIIFLDIETDGLHTGAKVLEVSAIACGPDLQYTRFVHLVFPYRQTGQEDPKVVEMHTQNGLFRECAYMVGVQEKGRPIGTPDHLRAFFAQFPGAWLAGRNVQGFDRRVLEENWPGITAGLSHRCIDIRTLIRLGDLVPGLWDGMNLEPGDTHRAPDDTARDREILVAMLARLRALRDRWAQ